MGENFLFGFIEICGQAPQNIIDNNKDKSVNKNNNPNDEQIKKDLINLLIWYYPLI